MTDGQPGPPPSSPGEVLALAAQIRRPPTPAVMRRLLDGLRRL